MTGVNALLSGLTVTFLVVAGWRFAVTVRRFGAPLWLVAAALAVASFGMEKVWVAAATAIALVEIGVLLKWISERGPARL